MTGRITDNGTVRLPWQLAWAVGVLLFLAGGAWMRQEIMGAENQKQLSSQASRITRLEMQVMFSRADADSMRSELMAEVKRSRSIANARMDDLEYRIERRR